MQAAAEFTQDVCELHDPRGRVGGQGHCPPAGEQRRTRGIGRRDNGFHECGEARGVVERAEFAPAEFLADQRVALRGFLGGHRHRFPRGADGMPREEPERGGDHIGIHLAEDAAAAAGVGAEEFVDTGFGGVGSCLPGEHEPAAELLDMFVHRRADRHSRLLLVLASCGHGNVFLRCTEGAFRRGGDGGKITRTGEGKGPRAGVSEGRVRPGRFCSVRRR